MLARFRLTPAILGLTVSLLSLPGFTGGPPRGEKLNVILVSLDQLQADRLHCYGNSRATSPNIDRLAEGGARFSRYYTVASWTAPSYSTLMSSWFPSRHGVTLFWHWVPGMKPLIDLRHPLLAQVFQAHGYRTAAFVANALGGRGLTDPGFEHYYQYQQPTSPVNITERGLGARLAPYRAPVILEHALSWLDQHASEPFFMFVLFWEPHSPYNPPPEDDLFKSDAYPDQTVTGYDIRSGHLLRLASLGDRKAVQRLYQLYDGKIHYIDRCMGRLMDHLRTLKLERKTLVVLTSDHGELMFSHPTDFMTADHRSLYNTNLHIPFILYGPPSLPKGKVVEALASNLDSAPTILDLAGLPPLQGAQGKSLAPLIQGKAKSINRYIFAEEDVAIPLRSVRDERYKLIYNLWTGKKQLFDERRDPGELNDVSEQNPKIVDELFARLQEWMKENQPPKDELRARWRRFTELEKAVTVDDQTIGGRMLLTGRGWHSDESSGAGYWEGGCFWTERGDGSRTATWRGDDPFVGRYKIYVYYGKLPGGHVATNAPFIVTTEAGQETMRVNFNENAGKWNLLGTFENPRTVMVTNATDGRIIADAVRFERTE